MKLWHAMTHVGLLYSEKSMTISGITNPLFLKLVTKLWPTKQAYVIKHTIEVSNEILAGSPAILKETMNELISG